MRAIFSEVMEMPRNGSGVYSKPANATATAGTKIESAHFNTLIDDIAADLNAARPVVAGGTGVTSIAAFKTACNLVIGTDIQAYNADLTALAGLTSAADRLPYFTGSGTASLADLSPFGRTLIDDPSAANARTTLELETIGQAEAEAGTATTTRAFTAQRVKQAIVALAGGVFNGYYESPEQTIDEGGLITLAHALGAVPKLVQIDLKCVSNDQGYVVDDIVVINHNLSTNGNYNRGISIRKDGDYIYVRTGSQGQVILNKTGNSIIIPAENKWKYIVRAFV
tara:strand:- start:117303 stop:118148 length:846 start_codon:yes stop_codon:yes gene_type:complete